MIGARTTKKYAKPQNSYQLFGSWLNIFLSVYNKKGKDGLQTCAVFGFPTINNRGSGFYRVTINNRGRGFYRVTINNRGRGFYRVTINNRGSGFYRVTINNRGSGFYRVIVKYAFLFSS